MRDKLIAILRDMSRVAFNNVEKADYLIEHDVVQVVRCENCKWCVNIGDGQRYCMWHSDGEDRCFVLKEYFCSYGKRKIK